jgi:hypothetical protein
MALFNLWVTFPHHHVHFEQNYRDPLKTMLCTSMHRSGVSTSNQACSKCVCLLQKLARMMQVCTLLSFELVEMLDQIDDNTMCESWFVWS